MRGNRRSRREGINRWMRMSMKSENRISARDDSLDLPSLRPLNLVKLPLDENR
jgi:hypothetical protein